MKKIISLLLCVTMLIACTLSVHATDISTTAFTENPETTIPVAPASTPSPNSFESFTDDHLTFTSSPARINIDSFFEFQLRMNIFHSDRFKVDSDSVTIATSALVYNNLTETYETDDFVEFEVRLHDQTRAGAVVGYYIGYADGIYGGVTFTNLNTDHIYYLSMHVYPQDYFASTGNCLDGYGNIYSITLVD